MPQLYDAFISYGRADSKGFANKLCESLTEQGYCIWFDQNDIPIGVDYQREIDDGLDRSHNFLFIMSPHALNSSYCQLEIERAIQHNKRIIPILHTPEISREVWLQRNPEESAEDWLEYATAKLQFGDERNPRLHPQLRKLNWIYAREKTDDFESALTKLVQTFERHKDYVEHHTKLLTEALIWQRHQRQSKLLLVGREREQAEEWLKMPLKSAQLPCKPSILQAEYITESLKNANNMMTQVFLCHSSEDRNTMCHIRRSLWLEGITIWSHGLDIKIGTAFKEEIDTGLEQSDNLVYLLSSHSAKSSICQYELSKAIALNKRIIPVLIEPLSLQEQPLELRSLQHIDFTGADQSNEEDFGLSKLVQVIQTEAEYFQRHKILLAKAIKWNQQHHNPSLLLRGYNLREAESWLEIAKCRQYYQPTDLHEEFIEASLRQPPVSSLDIFISYSRVDSEFARNLNHQLQSFGKLTWFDQESIANSSADFQREICRGIETSDNFLFILSPESIQSKYCAQEVEYAVSLNKRIITVLYRGIKGCDLHPELAKVQWLNFAYKDKSFDQSFNELIRVLALDHEYIHSHTKWLQRAIEWENNEQSKDLLLRGNEFAIAQNWLCQSLTEQKKPVPTQLQHLFLQKSEAAIAQAHHQEQRQKTRLRNLLALTSSVAIAAIGATVFAFHSRNKAILSQQRSVQSEGRTLIALSEMQGATNQKFESLLLGLQAAQLLEDNPNIADSHLLQNRVLEILRRVLYSSTGDRLLPNGQTLPSLMQTNQFSHGDTILSLSLSADGTTMASASSDGRVKVWDISGELQHTFTHDHSIRSVAFSPSGEFLAAADVAGTVTIWQLSTGLEKQTINHEESLRSISFSPGGEILASAGLGGIIRLWDLEGNLLQTFDHGDHLHSVQFSVNGRFLASAGNNQKVNLWNLAGRKLQTFDHGEELRSIQFHPNGRAIASAGNDGKVRLWETATGKQLLAVDHIDFVHSLSFSPDGNKLASAGVAGRVKLWDISDTNGQHIQTLNHGDFVHGVRFSHDGDRLFSAGGGTIKVWTPSQPEQTIFQHHDSKLRLTSLTFSANGQWLAAAGINGTVKLWNLINNQTQSFTHENPVTSISLSAEGHLLAAADEMGQIKLWDLIHAKEKAILVGQQNALTSVQFSPNNRHLATADRSGLVTLWDIPSQTVLTTLDHSDELRSISFSPNGKQLAAAGTDGKISLWDLATAEQTLLNHDYPIHSVTFSADGSMLASAGNEGKMKVWRTTGEELLFVDHGDGFISSVSFSPDGQMLATAGGDRKVKLWNLKGEVLQTFDHGDFVNSLMFSPTEPILATAADDGVVKFWDLDYDNIIERCCDQLRDYFMINADKSEELTLCQIKT